MGVARGGWLPKRDKDRVEIKKKKSEVEGEHGVTDKMPLSVFMMFAL